MTRPQVHWMHPGQWPVYIGFCTDEGAFQRCMKRMKVDDPPPWITNGSNATTHTRVKGNGGTTFVICIRPQTRKHSREQYAALIAHESLHVVQEMERTLYPSGRFDDESSAYLLQHIVQHCLTQAWNTGRTRKSEP